MSLLTVLEALSVAHRTRATGRLWAKKGDRRSELFIKEGSVVGLRIGFGYQSPPQALFAAGVLDARALDVLWARGGDRQPDAEMCEVLGLDQSRCREVQLIGQLAALGQLAEEVQFTPGPTEELFEPIGLDRVLAVLSDGGALLAAPDLQPPAAGAERSWADLL